MNRAVIILIMMTIGFVAYACGKVAKDADQWEEDWWDEHRDSGLYTDDE